MNDDVLLNIFDKLSYHKLMMTRIVSIHWKTIINNNNNLWSNLLMSDFNCHSSNPKHDLYLKHNILRRIEQTLCKIKNLSEKHEIKWAVVGGMALRHYGYKRMTRDLDIVILDNDDNSQLDRWEVKLSPILSNNGWYHMRHPLLPSHFNNYDNSWSHPAYNIKVDIMIPPIKHFNINENENQTIPFCSLLTLICIKLESYTLRYEQYEKDKDWNDVRTLIMIHNLPRDYLDQISSQKKRILYQVIYDSHLLTIGPINDINTNYFAAKDLNDEVMMEEMLSTGQSLDFSNDYFDNDTSDDL